jgi:hypothetical protein
MPISDDGFEEEDLL